MIRHPYLLGAAIGLAAFGLMLFVGVYFPSAASFAAVNVAWVHLAYYTTWLFGFCVWSAWRPRAPVSFWALAAGILAVHTAAFALYISHFGPLYGVHYVMAGIPEGMAIYLILTRRRRILKYLLPSTRASGRNASRHRAE